ncbi:MAG: hypothetical protein JNK00_12240 [Flavipsychrobacter sp.]|nr:hypothetical protein [Flavipsychrobacter sp.]
MPRIQQTLLTAIIVLISFSTVTYTACKKSSCIDMVCLNGGLCDGGVCSCPTGYTGVRCEEQIPAINNTPATDPCAKIKCYNGGVCKKGICYCPDGYTGTYCQTTFSNYYIGTFNGKETCTQGEEQYAISFTTASPASPFKMVLNNLYNDNYTAICTLTSSTAFSFSGSAANGTTYSGTGSMSGNTITISYTITNGSTSNTCSFVGSR